MDIYSPLKRSRLMSRIRSVDTKPELALRSMLHRQGFRFRLHSRTLPGRPDIVLPSYKAVVFVHGCFWHHHRGCAKSKLPATRAAFWRKKILGNVARDRKVVAALKRRGWNPIVVWECDLRNPRLPLQLTRKLAGFKCRQGQPKAVRVLPKSQQE